MKYRIHSPFLLLLTISACTTTNQVAPDHSTPLTSFPSVGPGSVTSVPSPQEQQENGTQMTQVPPPSGLQGLIDTAKGDLAQRLSIATTEISLVKAEEVVWSNATLGCPRPGIVYADVLPTGYLILLEANNDEYEYHTDLQDTFTFCDLVFKRAVLQKIRIEMLKMGGLIKPRIRM